jgi:hypothetical protein
MLPRAAGAGVAARTGFAAGAGFFFGAAGLGAAVAGVDGFGGAVLTALEADLRGLAFADFFAAFFGPGFFVFLAAFFVFFATGFLAGFFEAAAAFFAFFFFERFVFLATTNSFVASNGSVARAVR